MDELTSLTPNENLEIGSSLLRKGQYKESVPYFENAANNGLADAQNNLGHLYRNGLGVRQDYTEASKYFQLAARQGDAAGQYGLGICYEDGKGVKRNPIEAVKQYKLGADQGHEKSEDKLDVDLLDLAFDYAVENKNEEGQNFIAEIVLMEYKGELEADIKRGKEYNDIVGWGISKSKKLKATEAFLSFYRGESGVDILSPHVEALTQGGLSEYIQDFSEEFSKPVSNLKPSIVSTITNFLWSNSDDVTRVNSNIKQTSNTQDENTQGSSADAYITSTL